MNTTGFVNSTGLLLHVTDPMTLGGGDLRPSKRSEGDILSRFLIKIQNFKLVGVWRTLGLVY